MSKKHSSFENVVPISADIEDESARDNVVSCKVTSFNKQSNILVFDYCGTQYQTNEAMYDGVAKTIDVIYDGIKFIF